MVEANIVSQGNLRRWVTIGAALGIVAGAVFALFEMIAAAAMGDGFWMPLRMIGAIVLGKEALEPSYSLAGAVVVGLLVHMVLSALYGGVLGAVAASAPVLRIRPALVIASTLYGIGLWLFNFYVVTTFAFEWFKDADPTIQFVAHAFFYGTLLGVLLAAFQPREARAPIPQRA